MALVAEPEVILESLNTKDCLCSVYVCLQDIISGYQVMAIGVDQIVCRLCFGLSILHRAVYLASTLEILN